ncbi:hypothetical protein J0X14_02545 [Muricauda sp. CAU 1633]|uniref:hypothetical protein n=1 Tax=Allomuricauda sp. CAU 1633 TaxID=2816036 RepID=UPI001A8F25CF|nr:hypothetical protein [Muricauda sp. CAU 1633]MBO0321159.1 hypothetical protein [Muricauda sp. CAU 1633]
MNADTIDIFFWIILALVGITIGIVGYLLGRGSKSSVVDNSALIKNLEIENTKLRADLEACKKQTAPVEKPKPKSTSSTASPVFSFDAKAAKAALGKKVTKDDLKIVEGIGPKIQGLFHNFNIKTWKALSETSANTCQEVLNSGGKRYRIHDPASWPMQAKMAYEGHWQQLHEWQERHRAGKF